jgi:hypothetical protein
MPRTARLLISAGPVCDACLEVAVACENMQFVETAAMLFERAVS